MSSSYTRTPNKCTAHCPFAGCAWLKTYFDRPNRRHVSGIWLAAVLAQMGVKAHVAAKHKARTMINGR